MAIEGKRGCGYRRVGGLYLVGGSISKPCDRLPYPLETCPVCGAGIKITRGFTRVIPSQLFGQHHDCHDKHRPCFMCDPKDEPAFILGVGERYYKSTGDFMAEANEMGISKRIPFVPKELELGITIVYLSHPKACEVRESALMQQAMAIVEGTETNQPKLLDAERVTKAPGIFSAFIPQRVEKLIWESQATPQELKKLAERGITPVVVPDGDADHK